MDALVAKIAARIAREFPVGLRVITEKFPGQDIGAVVIADQGDDPESLLVWVRTDEGEVIGVHSGDLRRAR